MAFDPALLEIRKVFLDPRHMKDTLRVEVESPAAVDPITGVELPDTRTVRLIVEQPCSDQDLRLRFRTQAIVAGVPGNLPVSMIYTRHFPWPEPANGEMVVIRVNGKFRPHLKQGPPVDVGGQGEIWEIEVGPPQLGR